MSDVPSLITMMCLLRVGERMSIFCIFNCFESHNKRRLSKFLVDLYTSTKQVSRDPLVAGLGGVPPYLRSWTLIDAITPFSTPSTGGNTLGGGSAISQVKHKFV